MNTASSKGIGTRRVDVGGYHLALTCHGAGSPAVILDTGLGIDSEAWETVQGTISQFTHVCRYDRANRGQSDAAPKPRTLRSSVDDLHTLLHRAAVPAPYVLVGNSLGGMISRLYAADYPQEVAGLVLVDTAHEDQFDQMGRLLPSTTHDRNFYRFWAEDGWKNPNNNREGVDFVKSREQLRVIESLGTIPIMVLTSGTWLVEAPVGDNDAARAALHQRWLALHQEFTKLSPNTEQRVIDTSGHFIQLHAPQVVVDAVQSITETIRAT